jgi:ribosomal protein S18 acetylase RimI-like enzyme
MPGNLADTSLRPEVPEDEPFLLDLYAATRKEELDAVGWPPEVRQAFLKMQFNAQKQGYHATFPNAQFAIILSGGMGVGRIVINRGPDDFLLVDIALLPPNRGRGIGTTLLQELLREAANEKKPVRLSVFTGERASRLYQRLGFRKTGHAAGRDQMEWRA